MGSFFSFLRHYLELRYMKLSKKKESGYKRRFGTLKRVWCENVGVKSVKTGKKLIESLLILKFE